MTIVATVKVRAASGQMFDLPGDTRLATVTQELSRAGFQMLNSGWFEITFVASKQHLERYFHVHIPADGPFSSPVSPANRDLAQLIETLEIPRSSCSYV
jgi:hypothetical protein